MKKIAIIGLIGMILVGVASLNLPALADRTDACYQYMGSDQVNCEDMRNAYRSGNWDSPCELEGEFENEKYEYGFCHRIR